MRRVAQLQIVSAISPPVSQQTSHAVSHSRSSMLPHTELFTRTRQRLDRGDVKTRRTRKPLFDAAHSLVLAAGARQQQMEAQEANARAELDGRR